MDCVRHIALNQKVLRICNAKLHYTENYHVNSESGVNFQVTLKQNYTKRNHIKQALPVFFHGFSRPFWPSSAIMSEIDHIFYVLSCVIICYIKLLSNYTVDR